jgi:hypothetical protein
LEISQLKGSLPPKHKGTKETESEKEEESLLLFVLQ